MCIVDTKKGIFSISRNRQTNVTNVLPVQRMNMVGVMLFMRGFVSPA